MCLRLEISESFDNSLVLLFIATDKDRFFSTIKRILTFYDNSNCLQIPVNNSRKMLILS